MKLTDIAEALSKAQELDSIRMTYNPDHVHTTSSPHEYDKRGISPLWVKQRQQFLASHPEAAKMFAKGNEKREFQIRFQNVVEPNPPSFNKDLFAQICKRAAKIPNIMQLAIHKNTTMNAVEMGAAMLVSVVSKGVVNIHTVMTGSVSDTIIENYKKGLILIGKYVGGGDQEKTVKPVLMSIGKILKMNPEKDSHGEDVILKAFENDPFRNNVKTSSFDIIITGHPIDVYGMSTGRGWTSCADLSDKPLDGSDFEPTNAALYVGHDINNHAHMAYLVKHGGDIDHDAVTRVAFKLFHGPNGNTLLSEHRVYGTAPHSFLKTANNLMSTLFKVEEGFYLQYQHSYADNDRLRVVGDNPELSHNFIDHIKKLFHTDSRQADDFIPVLANLKGHNLIKLLDMLVEHSGFDKLEDNLELNNFEELGNTGIFGLFDLEHYIENYVDDAFSSKLLEAVPKQALSSWYFNSYEFKSALTLVIETIFQHIGFSIDGSNADSELAEIEKALKFNGITGGKFISLNHSELGGNPLRTINYIMEKFPTLWSILDLEPIRKQLTWRGGNTTMKVLDHIIDEVSMEHNNDFNKLHGGHEIPNVHNLLKSFGRLVHELVHSKKSVLVGDKEHIPEKSLDLLIQLESQHGDEEVSDIVGMEHIRSWIEQYLVDAIPNVVDVTDDGRIKLATDDEKTAKALLQFLKTETDSKHTIIKCLELFKSEQNLIELLD